MQKKRVLVALLIVVLLSLSGAGIYVYRTIKSIPQMFKLNEKCKAEGYYVADFEFKMLGCAYYLDKGQYLTALSRLRQLHYQLAYREGLIKVPEFKDNNEELDFYINLQNPQTGSFMDDGYPVFAYIGSTANVLYHIEYLCQETGKPLQLKYPLRYLDEINTPEKLKAFLDDLATVGWIGAKIRTPYIEACELNGYPEDMERTGLYVLTPEWNKALQQWFYDNQDSTTGYWGARLRSSGQLLDGGDLLSTEKILNIFLNNKGENLYPEFPLRYKNEMFATTLRKLAQPMPENLDEMHEWTLVMNRGTRLLTRYLWHEATPENQNAAGELAKTIVINKFAKTFIPGQGAFGLYSGAEKPDLDGTGETLSYLSEVGALSSERQEYLWGSPEKYINDLGVRSVPGVTDNDINALNDIPGVNSLRIYRTDPQPDYFTGVLGVVYPRQTMVLDATDLIPRLRKWIDSTPQSMGNWVAKESVAQELAGLNIDAAPVFIGGIPLQTANQILKKDGQLTIIGFDVLQRPICSITWRR